MLYRLSDGRAVIDRTLRLFRDDPDCAQIVAVVNEPVLHYLLAQDDNDGKLVYCLGGAQRCDSVYNGLLAVNQDVVLVHDGARCFLTAGELAAVKQAMETEAAAILTGTMTDTVKQVADGYVTATLDRDGLRRAQTPQGFRFELLMGCYGQALADGFKPTDEAQAVERYGQARIRCLAGRPTNIKVTTLQDVQGR